MQVPEDGCPLVLGTYSKNNTGLKIEAYSSTCANVQDVASLLVLGLHYQNLGASEMKGAKD